MKPHSRLDEARKRLGHLVRLQRPEEPPIEVFAAKADGKIAERARELMQRPEFERFRHKK